MSASDAIQLVVTDLDGTLWAYGSEGVPHEETLAAWAELDRRGVPVLVATGRRATTAREPLANYGLAPSAVVLNGALALDLATGECFHRHHYDVEVAAGVLAAFLEAGLEPCVYVEHDDFDVYVGTRPSTSKQHLDRARRACTDRRPRRDRGLGSGPVLRRVRERGARDPRRRRRVRRAMPTRASRTETSAATV